MAGRPKDGCPLVAETRTITLQPFGGWSIKTTDGFTIDGATATGAQTEIGSTDMYGFDMDSAGETATLAWRLPLEVDVTSPINFEVLWTPIDGTVAQTVTWKILYSTTVFEAGVALAAPSTVLDTVITADAEDDTPHAPQKSPIGIIAAGTLTKANRDAGIIMGLYIETDAISAGKGGHILGLDVTYTIARIGA